MAKYTAAYNIPEVVYDDICTQVQVKTPARVRTVFDTTPEADQGCNSEEFTHLTLCLRPVKKMPSEDYRKSKQN